MSLKKCLAKPNWLFDSLGLVVSVVIEVLAVLVEILLAVIVVKYTGGPVAASRRHFTTPHPKDFLTSNHYENYIAAKL